MNDTTTLTSERLTEIRASVTRAHVEIGDVCAEGPHHRFRMSIPASPDRDTDLIVSDALKGAEELLSEVERLRAKLDAPCGSCHPCTNYADETWRAAGRTPPHVHEWDGARAELETLRDQRDRLLALHEYDELIFGGFYCIHCTPDDADDPDDNVYWPCPSLRAVGVTDEEGTAIILAHRAEIARKAEQEASTR